MQAALNNNLTLSTYSSFLNDYCFIQAEPKKFCSRYYDASVGRFLQTDPDPGKISAPITMLSKYIYGANSPLMYTDPSGEFVFLAGFLASAIWGSSVMAALGLTATTWLTATVAASMMTGAFAALALVEGGKYGGDWQQMLSQEGLNTLFIAATGALGGWVGNYVKGLSVFNNLGGPSWLPSVAAAASGSAASSLTTTAILDATNIVNPTLEDYANGLAVSLLFGGTTQGINNVFGTNIGIPYGAISRGGWRFYWNYHIPNEKRR